MTKQMILDQDYIDSYSRDFSQIICDNHFTNKGYISGQDIVELTSSSQLNLMVIRELFEDWQKQVDAFTQNPYFDYKDKAVKEALSEFMNVLSRAIKIEQNDFAPLLSKAVAKTIFLAVDPVAFIEEILDKRREKSTAYVKELQKYIKWYTQLWVPAAEDWASESGDIIWKQKLYEGLEKETNDSTQAVSLLAPLQEILSLDFDKLIKEVPQKLKDEPVPELVEKVEEAVPKHYIVEPTETVIDNQEEEAPKEEASNEDLIETIDPSIVWAKFDSGENPYMKGSITHLKEGMGINQRIMFTKRLFQGNPDLMDQAIIELDATDSFFEAIDLLNQSFVKSLNWDIHSEEVMELLQLIFRKYDSV